jgi:GTP-binding protein Era
MTPSPTTPTTTPPTSCGYIGLIGLPNAGKSTLVNRLVGEKVSIVSAKPQTTRSVILGIAHHGPTELVLVDLPGFTVSRKAEVKTLRAAWAEGIEQADELLLMVDATQPHQQSLPALVAMVAAQKRPVTLALNKIDAVPKLDLLPLIAEWQGRLAVLNIENQMIFLISALNGNGVDDLVAHWQTRLPQGPWLFGSEMTTDQDPMIRLAELTREVMMHLLQDELPYNTKVATEVFKPLRGGRYRIEQVVRVSHPRHQAMVVGSQGEMIRRISIRARLNIHAALGIDSDLFLRVLVTK